MIQSLDGLGWFVCFKYYKEAAEAKFFKVFVKSHE